MKRATNPRYRSGDDPWESVERNHRRFVQLGDFFQVARPPRISDVEIVVCFSDIRGFTAYCNELQKHSQDQRIQNFLKRYLEIYSFSVLFEIWLMEPTGREMTNDEVIVRDAIIPTTYKNLGDGMMLVWELPKDVPPEIHDTICARILSIVQNIYEFFYGFFSAPDLAGINAYSEHVKHLKIGFGISRGRAWKLDFGRNIQPDYAGSIVNIAARLQTQARPEGVMCHYNVAPSHLSVLLEKRVGKLRKLTTLKGLGAQKAVFLKRNDLRHLARQKVSDHSLRGRKPRHS